MLARKSLENVFHENIKVVNVAGREIGKREISGGVNRAGISLNYSYGIPEIPENSRLLCHPYKRHT